MSESGQRQAFVALLRGINVGGHNKVRMKELVAALGGVGFEDVSYYIQSGNLVFQSEPGSTPGELEEVVEGVLNDKFGVEAAAMVISADIYSIAMEKFPFSDEQAETSVLVFLAGDNSSKWAERAKPHVGESERFEIADGVAYLICPNGLSKSKAAGKLLEKPPKGIKATMRNWRTVNKISDMLAEIT